MSEVTHNYPRSNSLYQAIEVHKAIFAETGESSDIDADAIVSTAETFLAFLTAGVQLAAAAEA